MLQQIPPVDESANLASNQKQRSEKIKRAPPPRPTSNTSLIGLGENLLIDYALISMIGARASDVCSYFFPWCIADFEVLESTMRGFRKVATTGKMLVHYDNKGEKSVVVLEIRGQGCRFLEQQDWHSWKAFFKKVQELPQHIVIERFAIKRLDVAIDSYTEAALTPKRATYYQKRRLISSRLQTIRSIEEHRIKTDELIGDSLYFGKRSSDLSFLLYNKQLESRGDDCWFRLEIRYRNAWGTKALTALLDCQVNFSEFIAITLERNIQFRSTVHVRSELRRRPLANWYLDYLSYIKRQSLKGG